MPDFGFSFRLGFLLTGHGSLGEFLKKRNLFDNESCFCGEAVEDFQNVLCSCPPYDDIRNLVEMQITQVGDHFELQNCLASSESRACLEVFANEAFSTR